MDEIIKFLMGNIVFVVIVVMGIIRVLTGGNNNQQKKQQPTRQHKPNQPRQTRIPSPSEGQQRPKQTVYQSSSERVYEEKQKTVEPENPVYTTSSTNIYTEEQHQMEQLKRRMNISDDISINEMMETDISLGTEIQDEIKHSASLSSNNNQIQFKKDVKAGLNREGLIRGIIMSEVLGPPRARKPYQNIITERKHRSS
jgi:hypothetical protein